MDRLEKTPHYILLWHNYTIDESDWNERESLEKINQDIKNIMDMYPGNDIDFKIISKGATEIIQGE